MCFICVYLRSSAVEGSWSLLVLLAFNHGRCSRIVRAPRTRNTVPRSHKHRECHGLSRVTPLTGHRYPNRAAHRTNQAHSTQPKASSPAGQESKIEHQPQSSDYFCVARFVWQTQVARNIAKRQDSPDQVNDAGDDHTQAKPRSQGGCSREQ
jgi:hypothetical protein